MEKAWYLSSAAILVWSLLAVSLLFAPIFWRSRKRRGTLRPKGSIRVISNYAYASGINPSPTTPRPDVTPIMPTIARVPEAPHPVVIQNVEDIAWAVAHVLGYILPVEQPQMTDTIEKEEQEDVDTCVEAAPDVRVPPFADVLRVLTDRAQPFLIPIGWQDQKLMALSIADDVNNILVTGQTNSGKDNWVRLTLLALALRHPPEKIQFALIDGKGLDWSAWQNKQHTWHLARLPNEILMATRKVTKERERRIRVLDEAGVHKWQDYTGGDLPLLVVFISELKLLRRTIGANDFEGWLAAELSVGRAAGIRYIIGTQNASRMGTDWRSQIALYVAGFQPAASQDEPNTNIETGDCLSLGALPPSSLPPPPQGSGMFCVTHGRDVRNVVASFLPQTELATELEKLPNRSPVNDSSPAPALAPALTSVPLSPSGDIANLIRVAYAIGQLNALKLPIDAERVQNIIRIEQVQTDKDATIRRS